MVGSQHGPLHGGPGSRPMHAVPADRAGATPGDIAILAPGRRPLTYGRLRGHIHEVVTTLKGMGVGRNDRVALVLPNGPEMAAAFLAVSAAAPHVEIQLPTPPPRILHDSLGRIDAPCPVFPKNLASTALVGIERV